VLLLKQIDIIDNFRLFASLSLIAV